MFQSVTIIVRITAILADLLHFNFYLVGDFYETDKKHACMAKASEQNTSTAKQTSEEDILQACKKPETSAQMLKTFSKT